MSGWTGPAGKPAGTSSSLSLTDPEIRGELGWSPAHKFEEALEATVDWYLANMDWVEMVRSGEYRKWIEINYEQRG